MRLLRAETAIAASAAASRSGSLQVDGAGLPALVVLEVVGEALVLIQTVHPGLVHRGDMNERVVPAAVGLNEAEALGGVEEFDCADRHYVFLSCMSRRSAHFRQKLRRQG